MFDNDITWKQRHSPHNLLLVCFSIWVFRLLKLNKDKHIEIIFYKHNQTLIVINNNNQCNSCLLVTDNRNVLVLALDDPNSNSCVQYGNGDLK